MMLEFPALILISSSLFNLGLILLIFLHTPRSSTKIYFILMTLGITLWMISNYLSNFLKDYQIVLWFNKLIFFTTSLSAYFFVLFSTAFPDKKIKTSILYFFTLFTLINAGFSLSSLIVKEISIKENFSEIIFGPGIYCYAVFILVCLGYSFFILYKKWHQEKIEQIRKSLLIFWIGMSIFLFLSVVTNLFFPVVLGKFEFTNFLPLYSTFFLIPFSISILKYEFLATRVILTEFLVILMGILLLIEILIFPIFTGKIMTTGIFILFCIFSYYLVKSVHEEEKRREEAERLAQKERELAEKFQVLAVRLMAVERSLREIVERERKLREDAEKLSKAKTEFIAITSHQLRTPLTVIKGYLSMISEGDYGEISPKLKEIIEKVLQSTERIIRLVNTILNISKIETGEMEMNWQRVDLREIPREIIEEIKIKTKEKNLNLELDEPKEKIENLVDREKIREVILNLLDNAIKYTQKGKIIVRLKRIIERNVDQISVKDEGEGMTKEELEKLFKRFSRGTAGMKFWTEGAGLGLFISKSFVEMHDGRIWAESEGKGKGTTFYIELPIR